MVRCRVGPVEFPLARFCVHSGLAMQSSPSRVETLRNSILLPYKKRSMGEDNSMCLLHRTECRLSRWFTATVSVEKEFTALHSDGEHKLLYMIFHFFSHLYSR